MCDIFTHNICTVFNGVVLCVVLSTSATHQAGPHSTHHTATRTRARHPKAPCDARVRLGRGRARRRCGSMRRDLRGCKARHPHRPLARRCCFATALHMRSRRSGRYSCAPPRPASMAGAACGVRREERMKCAMLLLCAVRVCAWQTHVCGTRARPFARACVFLRASAHAHTQEK